MTRKQRTADSGLTKVAVQCSADTFVVKIATFAKPETVMRHPMTTDSANIKPTEKMNRNTNKTEKPTAHLAHLVLPDTQANASQNQKS